MPNFCIIRTRSLSSSPEIIAVIKNLFLLPDAQTDQVPHQCGFATSAGSHDDKDLAGDDIESQIVLNL